MKPFFSIIIPTLNEERFLPKILSDLVKQKQRSFETIIVDANSEDRTADVANQFLNGLPLRFFSVKKKNVAFQKNYGANKAKGEYIVFLDADSRISTTFLKKAKKEIDKSHFLLYLPTVLPLEGSDSDKILFKISNFLVEVSQNFSKPLPPASFFIFKKNYFSHLGGFNEKTYKNRKTIPSEDHDLMLKVGKSRVRAKFMRNVKVGFSLRRMKLEGRFTVIRKYILSALRMTLTGKADQNIEYEMGGHIYTKKR